MRQMHLFVRGVRSLSTQNAQGSQVLPIQMSTCLTLAQMSHRGACIKPGMTGDSDTGQKVVCLYRVRTWV